MKRYLLLLLATVLGTYAFGQPVKEQPTVYADTTFMQDYSVKYNFEDDSIQLRAVQADREGKVQLLASDGLKRLSNGQFLYPGDVVNDNSYRFMSAKDIVGITLCKGEFVYLDKHVIFSNAWSGRLFVEHQLQTPVAFAANDNLEFLATDGRAIHFIRKDTVAWKGEVPGAAVVQVVNHPGDGTQFFLLAADALYRFTTTTRVLERIFEGNELTAFDVDTRRDQLVVGTTDGYFRFDAVKGGVVGPVQRKLPRTDIRAVKVIDGTPWFGTPEGAFRIGPAGEISYYASKRWLPDDHVIHIEKGPDASVLVLTDGGLGVIHFEEMTLHEKAVYYERQVRERHIRNGLNATLEGMRGGDVTTGYLADSDNDGLWTSLYLAAEAFRYAATGDRQALDHCMESLDAMSRLFEINPVPGFPARSFERRGTGDTRHQLADADRWQLADDPDWYWKATTSSDEAIGHIFAYSVVAELVDHPETRERAIGLIDTLMGHIVAHNLYLVDYDGRPTTWGRWNPEYVNGFPTNVGDRKLNSSNIISMLQAAYHFTEKAIYKETAFDLIHNHGYLDNLLRPMADIGEAPEGADSHSQMLSGAWNHSDDEMYFAGYWGLYRYAFNDSLKTKYKEAILDHWEAERPEKDGAWNIVTAITGGADTDLDEAIWYLKEYPMDLVKWTVKNSHRKDIQLLEPNFRGQTTAVILPPDELLIARHNANRFVLDGGNGGAEENSAGDIWLFPYWMGRYLGIISAPVED